MYIGVAHIKGPINLLYVIPLYLMAVSIFALLGKIKKHKFWYLPATFLGLILSLLAYGVAERLIAGYGGEASVGLGGIYLFSSYTIATLVVFIDFEKWRTKFKEKRVLNK